MPVISGPIAVAEYKSGQEFRGVRLRLDPDIRSDPSKRRAVLLALLAMWPDANNVNPQVGWDMAIEVRAKVRGLESITASTINATIAELRRKKQTRNIVPSPTEPMLLLVSTTYRLHAEHANAVLDAISDEVAGAEIAGGIYQGTLLRLYAPNLPNMSFVTLENFKDKISRVLSFQP